MSRTLNDEVVENRRRLENVFGTGDTAVSTENEERLDYFNNRFTLKTKTTVTQ